MIGRPIYFVNGDPWVMNNADVFVFMLKNAISKGMQDGGSTVLKEMAEMLPIEHLEFLEKIVSDVLKKKKRAIRT